MKLARTLLALCALAACSPAERLSMAPLPTPALAGVAVTQSGLAKQFFGALPDASSLPAAPYGSYAKGCLAGAVALPETGPTWQAMRLSRNRNWGHPATVDFVQRLSRRVAALPGTNGIYVGDISQPRGGPMLTGHASHQIGMDADIWLMPATLGLSVAQREAIGATSYRRAGGAYTNAGWSPLQHEMLKAAASDPAVARIFVFAGAKVRMCADATGDRGWLRKIRPWGGHHYHFHVRLACPRGAGDCIDQTPPPPGDGCDDARAWVAGILNPPPPDPAAPRSAARRELRMADLPQQCQSVLAR